MRLFEVPRSATNTLDAELPQADMEIDPRVLEFDLEGWKFDCFIRESTLTVTRIDKCEGWDRPLKFRLYDPEREEVPDFTSEVYTYHGLDGEYAPYNITEVIVQPSVTEIKECAFSYCKYMKKCTMDDGVTCLKAPLRETDYRFKTVDNLVL